MQTIESLQEQFLKSVRQERATVTVFLMNGFQLHGVVTSFDGYTVVIHSEGKQQMVYKHAISTVVPERPLSWEEDPLP